MAHVLQTAIPQPATSSEAPAQDITADAGLLAPNSHGQAETILGNAAAEMLTPMQETIAHPIDSAPEALDIRDVIGDHTSNGVSGGYLNFSVDNNVVTLGIDITDSSSNANPSYFALATIEGASGMSTFQILNTLLASHEIKFD